MITSIEPPKTDQPDRHTQVEASFRRIQEQARQIRRLECSLAIRPRGVFLVSVLCFAGVFWGLMNVLNVYFKLDLIPWAF